MGGGMSFIRSIQEIGGWKVKQIWSQYNNHSPKIFSDMILSNLLYQLWKMLCKEKVSGPVNCRKTEYSTDSHYNITINMILKVP